MTHRLPASTLHVAILALAAALLAPAVASAQQVPTSLPDAPAFDGEPQAVAAEANIDASSPEPLPPDASTWERITWWVARVWNFEFLHVGEKSVRVSQIVFAILTLVIGLWLSRFLTRQIRTRLLLKFRVDHSAAAAIEKILFYILVVVVVLMSLQVVAIPLTIFTFLGGAVAIGLGFGAQNIFNNFISGLILMLERPVRLGDLVEVDDYLGRVEEIRYRCTRIRRNDGIDVLVPNSKLLEQNVTNWTLADRHIRAKITVGVVYGSDTARVRELLEKAAHEHERVLERPEPIVIFEDFGDNSLAFDIYFWADITSMMDLRMICSDLRFTIDRTFREAGITIAFPQRDVHMDTLRPLEVRVVSDQKDNSAGGAADSQG